MPSKRFKFNVLVFGLFNNANCLLMKSLGSAVGIANGCGLDDRERRSSSPGRVNNIHLSMSSRPALRLTQWVSSALPPML
jgi:hypothetical protein